MILQSLTAISHEALLDNYKGRSGKFIKNFLLNDKRNKNGWRVTWDSILENASDFINHPGIYYQTVTGPDHTDGVTYKDNMKNQEDFRVANIVDVMIDEKTKTLNYVAEIIDDDFAQLYNDGKINMTSPGIWPIDYEVVGEMPNGRPMLDVYKWRALHSAYIDDPAYDDAAKTIATCDGDGQTCKIALAGRTITASDLAPLQEIPLIRKTLNNNYTPCQIKGFVAELLKSNTDVGNKLKEIVSLNPNEDADWQLSAAYAYNQENAIKAMLGEYFIPKELELGIKIEMEHTDNPDITEKIAKDHLREVPNYYTRLLTYVEPGNPLKRELTDIVAKPLSMTAREIIDLSSLVKDGLMSHAKYKQILKAKLDIDVVDDAIEALSAQTKDQEAKALQEKLIAKTELEIKLKEKQLEMSEGILKKLEEL